MALNRRFIPLRFYAYIPLRHRRTAMLQESLNEGDIIAICLVNFSSIPLAEAVGADALIAQVIADTGKLLLDCPGTDGEKKVCFFDAVAQAVVLYILLDTMRVEDGVFIVEKGSTCAPVKAGWMPEVRKGAIIKDNILQEDVECNSPSTAGWIAMGQSNNGWAIWKDDDEQPIDIYRKG